MALTPALRALAGLLLFGIGRLALAQAAAGDVRVPLADLIERTEPACVRLDVVTRDGAGIGSGFLVEKGFWIVTNQHVVAGAQKATATFADGSKAEVEGVLVFDDKRDVAVIKIKEDRKRTPLRLAEKAPRKGESVVAIGAPEGLSFTATEGIVSAIRDGAELREFGANAAGKWLQTSTPISPGSSGGPLLNLQGEVVGANAASLAGAQNLNFAIAAEEIATLLKSAAKSQVKGLASIPARPAPRISLPDWPDGKEVSGTFHLPAQRRFNHSVTIVKEDDAFNNVSWLRTGWAAVECADGRITSCGLRASVPAGNASSTVILEIGAVSTAGRAFGQNVFNDFQLRIDGELITGRHSKAEGDIGPGNARQRMNAEFQIQEFLKLVFAKEVKGRIGALDFKLSAESLECLRDLASRLPTGDVGQIHIERYDLADDPTVPASAKRGKSKTVAKAETAKAETAKAAKPVARFRTWTSADGKYKVEAKLLVFMDNNVELERKDNGQTIKIALATLSSADQEYVKKNQ